jgi:hypothetical protein
VAQTVEFMALRLLAVILVRLLVSMAQEALFALFTPHQASLAPSHQQIQGTCNA